MAVTAMAVDTKLATRQVSVTLWGGQSCPQPTFSRPLRPRRGAQEPPERRPQRGPQAMIKGHDWPPHGATELPLFCSHFASTIFRARRNTAANISSVSLPVDVFCWLGW